MKVLLIYPPRENYIFGITPHVYIEADAGNYQPIGMLYIAACLEKLSGIEIKVLDAHTERYNHEDVKKIIGRFKPDIIGVYFSTYYLKDSLITVENAKNVSPKSYVVAGGPHVALYPKETIDVPSVDCVMVGESEESFSRLAELLASGKSKDIGSLDNVLTKESASNKAPSRGKVNDLDSLPFPARNMIDYKKYSSILTKKNPCTTVITSRGCPFKCYFCSNLESGQRVRYRSPINVVNELEQVIKDYNIYDFLFFDELFTSDKERTISICNEVLKRGLKIRWHCRSRVDVLDEEMVKVMKKAGCRLIQFGIETGNQRLQDVINKKLDLKKVKETVNMVSDYRIYTYADFMFGIPSETAEETRNTLEFAKSLKLDYVAFGMFHPIPGSVFYDQGIKESKFGDFWRDYVVDQAKVIEDHSWTRRDREKFHLIMADAYKKFYFRPGFMIRKLFRIDSLSQMIWQMKSAIRVFSNLILKRFK
ncbi:MAG: radical SAM protein [Endomicrobiales bacterium]|nr:radical SAM protein [Endomicrobiales bacterium]